MPAAVALTASPCAPTISEVAVPTILSSFATTLLTEVVGTLPATTFTLVSTIHGKPTTTVIAEPGEF